MRYTNSDYKKDDEEVTYGRTTIEEDLDDDNFDPGLTQEDFDFVEKLKEEAFAWFEEFKKKRNGK